MARRRWKNGVAAALVGVFLVGFLADLPAFQVIRETKRDEAIPSLVPAEPVRVSPPMKVAQTYGRFLKLVFLPPAVCIFGGAVNDFQKRTCVQHWEDLAKTSALALSPLLWVLAYFFFAMDQLGIQYRKARRVLEKQKPAFQGTVTNPALTRADDFTWMYCLQGVGVEIQKGKQIVVYIPEGDAVPLPGEKYLVYEWGQIAGQKRHIGLLHAPHMAIVSGSKD
ncbi:MAG: hypothetical protein AB7P04_14835 [Bacteriovoracia bacterium]